MKTALIVFVAIVLLLALWVLTLRGKRKKTGFFGLAAYQYAHRGLHGDGVPENSLQAFRLAVENGYGAELDVHLSKDGCLVIMHDETLKRTADVERDIADCTAEELNEMRLEGTEQKIPYLEEVLPIFTGKTPLVIELKPVKGNHAELCEKVCAMLKEYPTLQFCIESFDPRVLRWLKRNAPEIVRGQLSCNFVRERNGLNLPLALLLTELFFNFLTVPDFVAYQFSDRKQLSVRICKKLWGVQEFSWTIRSLQEAKTASEEGALLIFEDCRP